VKCLEHGTNTKARIQRREEAPSMS